MGILDWLLHRDKVQIAPQERERINEALERILAMNPQLRMGRRY